MGIFDKFKALFTKKVEQKKVTAISPEIRQLIPLVRQDNPQLAHLPDEAVALLLQQ